MHKNMIGTYKHVHFIGIGGISMSGLAEILASEGYIVSGSDQKESDLTKNLTKKGIVVYLGHKAEHIASTVDLVVYTASVKPHNPERQEAEKRHIQLMERSTLLGLLMKNYHYPICVAGTHGKTTTSSMLSQILLAANANPTLFLGGVLPSIGSAMRNGGSEFMVVESCEYHDSFLQFFPKIGIILNIDKDHLDYFSNLEQIRHSFLLFAKKIPNDGLLVIHKQIANLEEIVNQLSCRVQTYGITSGDWQAKNISFQSSGCASFDVFYKDTNMGFVTLSTIGLHNVENALSVYAVAHSLGISHQHIAEGLLDFSGALRRFQKKGEKNGVVIYDDYAHHPTEVKATIAAVKNLHYNRLCCVFQPHTHERTHQLLDDFAESFDGVDLLVCLDIYVPAGRTENLFDVHTTDLVKKLKQRGISVYYCASFEEAKNFLNKHLVQNDLLITMGAGDVYTLGESLLSDCQ